MIWEGSPLGTDRNGSPISHTGNEPTLVVGPPGVNKTMGQAVVELLNDEGNRTYFVWDPSLELAAICANRRREVCGPENVDIMNSYDVLARVRPDLKSSKWNPLTECDADSPMLSDFCNAIGDAVVPASSNEMQKHFVDSARSAVSGMTKAEILEAAATGSVPSLPNVRARLTQDADTLRATIKKILDEHPKDFDLRTRLGRYLNKNVTDEMESVRSNVESAMGWMSDALCRDLVPGKKQGVCFRRMRDVPTTIFCGLPPAEDKPAYMRLVLSLVLRALYREDGVPATLLIDEAYVLGRHEETIKALSILRKYNCRVTLVYQSIAQVMEHFPKTWGLFTGGAMMGFRATDKDSAEFMSFRAGEEVVPTPSYADPATPAEVRVKPSWQPQKRERIRAGKMFSMPRGKALVWLPGDEAPRISTVKGYFDIPELASRADPNPYYKPPVRPASGRSAGQRRARGWGTFAAAGVAATGAWLWPGSSFTERAPVVEARAAIMAAPAPIRPHVQKPHRHAKAMQPGGFHE